MEQIFWWVYTSHAQAILESQLEQCPGSDAMGENRRQHSDLSSSGQFWAVLSFWNLELAGEGRVYVYPSLYCC